MAGESEFFTVKQVADVFGNTRGAIRFYQEKGLVAPEVDERGYRHFSMDDIFQLIHLRSFAALSISLDDVAARFSRESDTSIADVLGVVDERLGELHEEVARLHTKMDELEDFRRCILESREESVRIEEVGEYWALDRAAIAQMMREDRETFAHILSLAPLVSIGSEWDLGRGEYVSSNTDIRFDARLAHSAGIGKLPCFRVLPAGKLARTTMRCRADELDAATAQASAVLYKNASELGWKPENIVTTRLAFIHEEAGSTVEYRNLFVRVTRPGM